MHSRGERPDGHSSLPPARRFHACVNKVSLCTKKRFREAKFARVCPSLYVVLRRSRRASFRYARGARSVEYVLQGRTNSADRGRTHRRHRICLYCLSLRRTHDTIACARHRSQRRTTAGARLRIPYGETVRELLERSDKDRETSRPGDPLYEEHLRNGTEHSSLVLVRRHTARKGGGDALAYEAMLARCEGVFSACDRRDVSEERRVTSRRH